MSSYPSSDPRSQLAAQPAAKAPAVKAYAGADYARFYAEEPQQAGNGFKTWMARDRTSSSPIPMSRPVLRWNARRSPTNIA